MIKGRGDDCNFEVDKPAVFPRRAPKTNEQAADRPTLHRSYSSMPDLYADSSDESDCERSGSFRSLRVCKSSEITALTPALVQVNDVRAALNRPQRGQMCSSQGRTSPFHHTRKLQQEPQPSIPDTNSSNGTNETQGRLSMHRRSGMIKNIMKYVPPTDSPALGWMLDGWVSTKAVNNNTATGDHSFVHFSPQELALGAVLKANDIAEYREATLCCDDQSRKFNIRLPSEECDDYIGSRQSFSSTLSFASSVDSGNSFDFTEANTFGDIGWKKRNNCWMLKKLKADWYTTKKDAAVCMAYEVNIMKGLVHSNIQRLRGTVGQPGTGSFGILLTRPAVILEDLLPHWKLRKVKNRGVFGIVGRRFDELNVLFTERLVVAYGIAKGIKFLHARNVLHLGICPTSIACDHRGNAKIFDFSSAVTIESVPGIKARTDRSCLHYCAPEMLEVFNPDTSADIYSFGILFWQMMALSNPYKKYIGDDAKLMHKIAFKGKRPPVSKLRCLPKKLQALTRATWSETRADRPKAKDICQFLGGIVAERRGMKRSVVGDQFAFKMDRSFSFCDSETKLCD